MSDPGLLAAVRAALEALDDAERERSRAWAWSGSGLLENGDRRLPRMEAERALEEAHGRLRKAREALGVAPVDGRSWGAH